MINSKQHHIKMQDYSACHIGNLSCKFFDSSGNSLEIDSETLYCVLRVMYQHLQDECKWYAFEEILTNKFPSMDGKIFIE